MTRELNGRADSQTSRQTDYNHLDRIKAIDSPGPVPPAADPYILNRVTESSWFCNTAVHQVAVKVLVSYTRGRISSRKVSWRHKTGPAGSVGGVWSGTLSGTLGYSLGDTHTLVLTLVYSAHTASGLLEPRKVQPEPVQLELITLIPELK